MSSVAVEMPLVTLDDQESLLRKDLAIFLSH